MKPKSHWRQRYRPTFEQLLAEAFEHTWTVGQLAAAIHEHFGPMSHNGHIYQMWLKEKRLCFKAFEAGRSIASYERWHRWPVEQPPVSATPPDPNQERMDL